MSAAIVISSCDLYKDCWLPIIHSFQKYWPDCPFPLYIISNHESLDEKGINFIKVGKHMGFGSNMKKALQVIEEDYVILFLEDFFLKESVDNKIVISHLEHCIKESIDYLKIDYHDIIYRDELRLGTSIYCANPLDIKYSLNAAIAIWRREALQSLCVEGFSAWDFERKGINYINKNKLRICSETIFSTSFDNNTIKKISGPGAVSKGRWTLEGITFLKENGFSFLIPGRKVEGRFTRFLTSQYTPNSLYWLPLGLLLRIIQKLKINI